MMRHPHIYIIHRFNRTEKRSGLSSSPMYLLLIASLSLVAFGLYETASTRLLHDEQKELILRKINVRIVDNDAVADKVNNIEGMMAYGKLWATKKVLTNSDTAEPERSMFTSNPGSNHLTSSAPSLRRSVSAVESDVGTEPTSHREVLKIEAYFTNTSKKHIQINWVNVTADTNKYQEIQLIHNLPPNKSHCMHVHPGHSFVAHDKERSFRAHFHIDEDAVVSYEDGIASSSAVHFIFEGGSKLFESDGRMENLQEGEGMVLTTTAKFINSYKKPINLYWRVNINGEELQLVQRLVPKVSTSIESRIGHVFVANDEEKTFRTEFNVSLSGGVEEFRIDGNAKHHGEEKHYHPEHEKAKTNFINSSSFPLYVNWISEKTGEEEEVIPNLSPTEEEVLETYRGHSCVVYNEERAFRKAFVVSIPAGHIEKYLINDSIIRTEL